MADYYYGRSSIDGNSKGTFGAKFQRWSNSTLPSKGERHSDHVYSPGVLGSTEEPPKVREFIYSVQNAACMERRVGFLEGRNGYTSNYENMNDTKANGWKKPGNGYASSPPLQEHPDHLIPGTGRPSQPSYSYGYGAAPLSRATGDHIGTTTVSYTKGSGCPPVTRTEMINRWSPGADAMMGNTPSSGVVSTIDSSEAAKKYNGYFM